jgi:molybdopterin-biosynthesis enzyme MoeA-like protein
VPDIEEEIVAAVNALRARYDYVFTTGGIGPTHDDITSASVAKAFGVKLIRHPEAVALLRSNYANPADLNEARLRMADVPEGATLVLNPVSKAPGFRIANVIVMAGVPRIMQAMFDGLRHSLAGGPTMLSRAITANVPEGKIAAGLTQLQERYAELEIGSYPFFRQGQVGTTIVLRGFDRLRIDAAAGELEALMVSLGGTPVEETEGEPQPSAS